MRYGTECFDLQARARSRETASVSSVMSFRLSACMSAAPTGRISLKFDIGDVYESLSGNPKFG
jgi:hypothetical protein